MIQAVPGSQGRASVAGFKGILRGLWGHPYPNTGRIDGGNRCRDVVADRRAELASMDGCSRRLAVSPGSRTPAFVERWSETRARSTSTHSRVSPGSRTPAFVERSSSAGSAPSSTVSPGSRPRPSLSAGSGGLDPAFRSCVAGVSAPAFVERWTTFSTLAKASRVSPGSRTPAFVERSNYMWRDYTRMQLCVSPGSRTPAFVERSRSTA